MIFKSRNILKTITLIVMAVSLTHCISETEIDIPFEPAKLSVICHPTPGQYVRAILGYSSMVTDNTNVVQNISPQVDIFSENDDFDSLRILLDDTTNKPYWQGTKYPKVDSTYTLRIVNPEFPFDTITARTSIPRPLIVTGTADMDSIPATVIGDRIIQQIPISITVDDIWQSDSLFAASINFVRYNFAGLDHREAVARFVAPGSTLSYLHVAPDNTILVEKKFWENNLSRTLNLTLVVEYLKEYEKPDSIKIEWRTVSGEYYDYYLSIARQGNISLPFNDPDILYNNINGGYGTFSGYSSYKLTIPL